MNTKETNNKNQKPHMSFWGIGPMFGIINVIVVGIAAIFTFVYPEYFIVKGFSALFYILGAIGIMFGFYLWLSAGKQIDKCILKGVLATNGTYGIVRNPIYSGILFVTMGGCFVLQSWLMLSVMPFICLVLSVLLRKEDKVLTESFGEEYIQYKNQVNLIFPKLSSILKAFFYPVETQKITERLFAVKSKDANFFIYKTENQYLCFDTGYGNKEILDELSKLDIKPEDITTVFLTHSDPDHSKGIHFFPKSKLYFGKNEEPLINGTQRRLAMLMSNPKITRDYCLLEDNQIITIDDTEIKTIYAIGHTIGHVLYQINDEIIISGDAVIFQNGFIKPFYRFFNMNHKQTIETAKKIMDFEGKYLICTAHTGVIHKA